MNVLRFKKMFSAALFIWSVSSLPAHAQSPQLTSGRSWLATNQSQDGSWQSASVGDFQSTAEVLSTLSMLGNTDASYNSALAWLTSQSIDSTDSLARRIAVQGNSYLSTDLSAIVSYQYSAVGWGVYNAFTSDTLDTTLALLALKSSNYTDTTVINNAITYLTANQNTDGGFGFSAGDTSNTYMTAMVLNTLSQFKSIYDLQTPINKASTYLMASQSTDGGFGSSPSTVYETALSVVSLIESGQGQAQPLQNAINYLTTTQSANGSWNDDPYSTALALRALAYVRPNLTLASTDISFSNPMPQVGTEVTITATVRNTGLETASNVTVRFFNGDPAAGGVQVGADQIIASLAANSSAQVSLAQTFTATGSKIIFVQVDPANQVSEISKADNLASARLWVATAPDLAVFSEDIKPSTFVPVSSTPFTLEYTVRNLGESAAYGFDVSIYDGPSTGSGQGILLQTSHMSGLNGTEVRTGTFGVTLTGDGSHTLYLVADSGNLITESSKTNNTGTITVNVGGTPTLADLSITPMDITLTPSRPQTGDTVQINARIRNQGAEVADSFTFEIFDGAPESGGTPILSQIFTIPAGADQTVSTNWPIPAGIHEVNVIIDRGNQIVETNEANNRATVRVMTDMVDVALSATDLVLNPGYPVVGDAIALTITANNQGIKDTGAFNLVLYDGDPNANGGQGQAQPLQTFSIANIPGDGSATLTYTFTV